MHPRKMINSKIMSTLCVVISIIGLTFPCCCGYGLYDSLNCHTSFKQTNQINNPSYYFVARRRAIIIGGAMLSFSLPLSSEAVAADAGEAIRRSAANLPGFGPTDVFLPLELKGSWKLVREVEFAGASSDRPPLILEYPYRFIISIEENSVVADRGANQKELEEAITRAVNKGTTIPIQSYEWSETNPNDLRLVFGDGTRKEIKVTKRATERTNDGVSSSEFQRVTQEDMRGIPVISARRVLTKWKVIDENTVEGIEVIYDVGGGDPLAGSTTSGSSSQPKLLSKSRLHLKR